MAVPPSKTSLVYPRRQAIRAVLRAGISAAFSVLMDLKIEGKENFPASGPLILVGNHFAFLDPVALIHATPYPLEFLGGLRTPNAPAWADIFRVLWGTILVRRGSSSRDALLSAQSVLEQNGVVAVFPEGGSWAAVLRPPRPGTALLAAKTPARILPIGLDGLLDVFPAFSKGKRAQVTIRVGSPFGPVEKDPALSLRQHMDRLGHEMMRRIAELIPPERRGFYSDDPAIRAAAKGTEIYPWETTAEA